MNRVKTTLLSLLSLLIVGYLIFYLTGPNNKDPLKTKLISTDIDNFWIAYDKSNPDFDAIVLQELYLSNATKGVNNIMSYRIQNAEHLSKVLDKYPNFYKSIRTSTDRIPVMKENILNDLVKFKELYPKAIFPPVYFVIGAMNSGGTSFRNGLIICAEMYALTPDSPTEELNDWQKQVLKPVDEIPIIVMHELVHFQQNNSLRSLLKTRNLLSSSIDEGAADFLAELVTGKHLNNHVHNFANPIEEKLWNEFKEKMLGKDYTSWLNSTQKGRPADLGYWMGYKIVKSYYENAMDKKKAISEIINIRDYIKFLKDSKYTNNFIN